MTLIKSLLLGSAAGIVAVATAQAADLPTRKAAPVEYVRVCNVGGITGWTMPGSDTCVKFSGYMTAHVIAGNASNQYNSASAITSAIDAAVDPFASAHLSQVLMVQGGDHAVSVFNGSAVPMPLRLYGDSSGNARSTKSSKTDYDLIAEYFRARPAYKLRNFVPSRNEAVKDRVNSVNALLHDATGRVRTFIDPKCRALRRDNALRLLSAP